MMFSGELLALLSSFCQRSGLNRTAAIELLVRQALSRQALSRSPYNALQRVDTPGDAGLPPKPD